MVVLTPRNRAAEFGVEDKEAFLGFLSACFRQKRKMLRNNLRAEFPIDGPSRGQASALGAAFPAGLRRSVASVIGRVTRRALTFSLGSAAACLRCRRRTKIECGARSFCAHAPRVTAVIAQAYYTAAFPAAP